MRKKRWTNCTNWLCCALACLLLGGLPAATAEAAPGETFTIVYKTNAGVTMGEITYNVDDVNSFPATGEFRTHFGDFITRAAQKGTVAIAPEPWYEDAAFTQKAAFPAGQAGETYTVYCRFTTGVQFGGIDKANVDQSYDAVFSPAGIRLGGTFGASNARTDQYDNTVLVFEKRVGDRWQTVPESYYTCPYNQTEWTNIIWMRDVADSGTYRLKHVVYTATDNSGAVLYYDYDHAPAGETYTVNIRPAALSIDGVSAVDRAYDGTEKVALEGGTLHGVLHDDDVSFVLGQGTMDSASAGEDKMVTTHITLTGEKAGNYTLAQPTLTVSVKKAEAAAPQGVGAVQETVRGQKDGRIVGLKAGMEYRLQGQTAWTAVTQDTDLAALAPGVYEVRTAGDENHEPSAVLTVTVQAGEQAKGESAEAVATADGRRPALWIALALAAAGGFAMAYKRRKMA